METQRSHLDLILILVLLAGAVLLVDDRWLRAAVTIVPALLLMQRASSPTSGEAAGAAGTPTPDRRTDADVRAHVDELLKQIREFYSTCHLMASGQLAPELAKERASITERALNSLLAKVSEGSEA